MKVLDLICELMKNCQGLDDDVDLYVCGKTEVIEEYVEQAENQTWCIDEILEIDDIEDIGGHIWIKAKEISL